MIITYEENVATFEKIDSSKAQELVKGEGEAVIYIGKAVCPYCQKFVKKLKKLQKKRILISIMSIAWKNLIWKILRHSVMNMTFQRFLVSSLLMVT